MTERTSVFISYSRGSESHRVWVVRLAERLDAQPDLHVVFDAYDLYGGKDLLEFMERCRQCERVVLVVTPTYVECADQRKGGIGYEILIAAPELLESPLTDKFIPVLREGSRLPAFVSSKTHIDFRNDGEFENRFEELLRAIRRQTDPRPPKDGEARVQVGVARRRTGARPIAFTLASVVIVLAVLLMMHRRIDTGRKYAFAAGTAIAVAGESTTAIGQPIFERALGALGMPPEQISALLGEYRAADRTIDAAALRTRRRDLMTKVATQINVLAGDEMGACVQLGYGLGGLQLTLSRWGAGAESDAGEYLEVIRKASTRAGTVPAEVSSLGDIDFSTPEARLESERACGKAIAAFDTRRGFP